MKCILLLHGFLSDKHDFEPIIEDLNKQYDYVHRICFPGHGIAFGKEKFTEEATFALLDKTYQELAKKYQTIDVIGYSMGGALGAYLASKYPIHRLVLLAPAYKYFNLEAPIVKAAIYWRILKGLKKAKKEHETSKENKFAEKLSFVFEDDKKSLHLGARAFLVTALPKYFLAFRKIIKRVTSSIEPYNIPTLILWGELDQLVPRGSVEEVYQFCLSPEKKKIIFDDITHLMLLSTNNQKLIDAIFDYLVERDSL